MKRFLKAQWPMLLIVGILLGCGVSQLADHSWMNAVSSFIMAGYAFLCAVLIDENNRLREAFHAQRKQVQEGLLNAMCLRPIIGHLDLGDKAVVTYDGGNHYTVDYVRHIEEPEAVEDYEARP